MGRNLTIIGKKNTGEAKDRDTEKKEGRWDMVLENVGNSQGFRNMAEGSQWDNSEIQKANTGP